MIARFLKNAVVAAVALALLRGGEPVEIDIVPNELLRARLERGLVRQAQRETEIAGLFADVGCETEPQRVDKHQNNVICTLPGETSDTIVTGGHFDFVDRGKGIVDDWSGSSMLPSLYQSLKRKPHRHTYVFVAFASEETGLDGSRKYVKSLSAQQKKSIKAFINLECLGLAPPKVWLSKASPELAEKLLQVSHSIGVGLQAVNVDNFGDDDSHSFRDANIPAITLHSLTPQNAGLLHSPADSLKAINMENYEAAYKLAAYYLAYLDATP